MAKCLICHGETTQITDQQITATYAVCESCGFISKNKEFRLSSEDELKSYALHNNSFESAGYVKIFEDLINDFIIPLKITGKVLEYGSGPGPVLKELLIRKNYDVIDYDPFYNDDLAYLNYHYELITSTEVVEHFFNPLSEFEKLANLLKPQGYLVITTKLRTMGIDNFLTWWYKRDVTHVSFYTIKSLKLIALKNNLRIIKTNYENVIIFQKL